MSEAWMRWSASKINAFHCPLRGFHETVLAPPVPQTSISVFGASVHYSFERFYRRHPRTRRFPFEERKAFLGQWFLFWWSAVEASGASLAALQMYEEWIAKVNEERQTRGRKPFRRPKPHGFEGWSSAPELVEWENDEQPAAMFRWGRTILGHFHDDFVATRSDGTQRYVEQRFNFRWHGYTMTGRVDRIDVGSDGGVITDYKLSLYTLPVLETGVQFTLYQLAWDEYFRRRHPDWPPLRAIRLYNYHKRRFQTASLRSDIDVGLLLAFVTERSEYLRAVLTGTPVDRSRVSIFRWFSPDDIERGDISPLLPRGDHCQYCRHFEPCRAKELGETQRTSRELFSEKYQALQGRAASAQGLLFPMDVPVIRQGAKGYAAIDRTAPGQPLLFPPEE